MRLVGAHKGGRVYRCRVTGRSAHSSLTPTAVNAIEAAAALVARIREMARREHASGRRVEGFDVPFTTISTNLIEGGTGGNIVPADAVFLFDYRYVPGFDPDSIIEELCDVAATLAAEMRAVDDATGISFDLVNDIPPLDAPPAAEIYRLVESLLPREPPLKVSYGTEASFFQAIGVPSVVCGPGSIEQAHGVDEFVTLEQLARCDRFVDGVVSACERRLGSRQDCVDLTADGRVRPT
jgi:acetylornithine deacetylase